MRPWLPRLGGEDSAPETFRAFSSLLNETVLISRRIYVSRPREKFMPGESETANAKQKEEADGHKLHRLWAILNSQFVLWFLGSVVLAGITAYWNYRNDQRLENEK